jgi:membrane protease YdiL (CAAX protease family)
VHDDVPSETFDPSPSERSAPAPPGRAAALFEVILCSGFPTQLLVAQVLFLLGLSPLDPATGLSLAYVVALLLTDATLMLLLIFGFLRLHGERPAAVFLGHRRFSREALIGLLLIPAVFALVLLLLALIQAFAPWLRTVEVNPLQAMIRTPAQAVLLGLVAVVSGGFREEIQRAFILHRFEQSLGGAVFGLIVFSMVFAIGHTIQGWDVALTTGVLGAFWGIVFLTRRSIVAPVVSHAGFNMAEIIRYTLVGS